MITHLDASSKEGEGGLELCVRTGLRAGRPLGDVVADFTHATGLDRIANAYSAITGQDCGCDRRQEALNNLCPNTPL
ncbi:MAG: hypothetical protein R3E79_51220 [Caldilineaceae bacterium]